MREIKFKANRFGTVFDVLEWDFTGHPDRQDLLLGKDGKEIVRESIKNLDLMEYTGLKDKNGKEIYEGDIVKFIPNFSKREIVGRVIFDKGCFYVSDGNSIVSKVNNVVEVIGNIYENLELLYG